MLLALDVQVRFDFADSQGHPISSAHVGDNFDLNVYVKDIRSSAAGLFQAYLDVNYAASLVSVAGSITHSAQYNANSFGTTSVPGLVDEAGGVDTDQVAPVPPNSELLLFSVPFHGTSAGTLNVTADLAESPVRQIILFDRVSATPLSAISFVGGSIDITSAPQPKVSITATQNGAEAGPVAGAFTVSQSSATNTNTVVSYSVGGTAAAGSDYTALSGNVTISAGQTSATINIPVINDALVEGAETVVVSLNSVVSGDPTVTIDANAREATLSIADNDSATVSIAVTTGGNEAGPVSGVFTVAQSAASSTNTVVSYTVSGTAASGADFTALSGSVTISAGQTSATISVPVINDALAEGSETVMVTLSGVSGDSDISLQQAAKQATLSIADNDSAKVSIVATTGGSETGPANGLFTVTQSAASATDTVVAYSVSGTAASGADYTTLSGSATIPAGQTSATIIVPVIDDAIAEGSETVIVTLNAITSGSSAVSIDAGAKQATISVTDDDGAKVSIAATTDGNEAGPVSGAFTVTQSAASTTNTVVRYTVSGTAASGADFTALSGSVTIPAGQTLATVTVPVMNDTIVEDGETVIITLNAITSGNPTISIDAGAKQATLSIADNDSANVSIAATTGGNEAGPASGVFTVTQSAASSMNTVASYTISGTATSGADFTPLSGSVTIPAGQKSSIITVPVLNDTLVEGTETVVLTLSGIISGDPDVSLQEAAQQATLSIADNDSAKVGIAATTGGNEAGPVSGAFSVTQSAASTTNTVVSYTVSGTATSGTDYTALSGSVTILAGQTSATITVPVINDPVVEGSENVKVTLNNTGSPAISIDAAHKDATLLIADDDGATVSIARTQDGAETGPVNGVITVTQSAVSATNTVVSYTVSGTATSSADYRAFGLSVTIPAGQTSVGVTVPVINDAAVESIETVSITLKAITSGNPAISIDAGAKQATLSIVDDDGVKVGVATTTNGAEAGPVTGVFTVTQSAISITNTVVSFTVGGSAIVGADYASFDASATILAGQTSATITVPVIDDAIVEGSENVIISLNSASNPAISIDTAHKDATLLIADNDSATVSIAMTQDGAETGPVNGVFTVTQTAVSSADTMLDYTVSGTAVEGSDYAALSATVTIPAGQTSVTIIVPVLDETLVESTETVTVALNAVTSGAAAITIDVAASQATLSITDNDTAQVSVAATIGGNESRSTSVVFSVTQTATSSTSTVIAYTLEGTATAGSDYTDPSGTVTIPAGQTSAAITVPVINDTLLEGTEFVIVTLTGFISGDVDVVINPDGASAAATIGDDETGLISVATTANGSESGPTPGRFTVLQDGSTAVDTVVSYTIIGTATPNADFIPPPGVVTIPAGQTSAIIDLPVLDDLLIEGPQAAVLILAVIVSGDSRLLIDPTSPVATLPINDDDTGQVSIVATGGLDEGSAAPTQLTVILTGHAESDLVIGYAVSGSATSGQDFMPLSGTVTIHAGETSAMIELAVIDDGIVEDTETIVATLTHVEFGPQITIDAAQSAATVPITDDDVAQLAITSTSDGDESGPISGTFIIIQTAISSKDTVISYTLGGTATAGGDYAPLSAFVTIPAGQTSKSITLQVIDDTVVEGAETSVLTLDGVFSGNPRITVGSQNQATVHIDDNDHATIGFASPSSRAIEVDGTHVVAVRLSIPSGGTLERIVTINVIDAHTGSATSADYSLTTTTITFGPGSHDGIERDVTLSIVDDGVFEPDETAVLGLVMGSDGSGGHASLGEASAHTVTISDDPLTGVISGIVWADTNGNSHRDAHESLIPGVTIRLSGVDRRGQTVERTLRTNDDGVYAFTNLAGGTYDVTQRQPQALDDGTPTLGTIRGATIGQVAANRFTEIALPPGQQAVEYNFGEAGLKAQYVTARFFLATTFAHTRLVRDTVLAAEAAADNATLNAGAPPAQLVLLAHSAAPAGAAAKVMAESSPATPSKPPVIEAPSPSQGMPSGSAAPTTMYSVSPPVNALNALVANTLNQSQPLNVVVADRSVTGAESKAIAHAIDVVAMPQSAQPTIRDDSSAINDPHNSESSPSLQADSFAVFRDSSTAPDEETAAIALALGLSTLADPTSTPVSPTRLTHITAADEAMGIDYRDAPNAISEADTAARPNDIAGLEAPVPPSLHSYGVTQRLIDQVIEENEFWSDLLIS